MHKDELTDFEKEMCEVWFRATDKYKVSMYRPGGPCTGCCSRSAVLTLEVGWYEFRVKALNLQLRRLRAEWQAIPHDPKRRFTIASEQYWLTVQIRDAKKDWSWNLAYSFPLHSSLWDDVSMRPTGGDYLCDWNSSMTPSQRRSCNRWITHARDILKS